MGLERFHSLAIVDEQNRIVGNISASDLRGITIERIEDLLLPVLEFVDKQRSKGT